MAEQKAETTEDTLKITERSAQEEPPPVQTVTLRPVLPHYVLRSEAERYPDISASGTTMTEYEAEFAYADAESAGIELKEV